MLPSSFFFFLLLSTTLVSAWFLDQKTSTTDAPSAPLFKTTSITGIPMTSTPTPETSQLFPYNEDLENHITNVSTSHAGDLVLQNAHFLSTDLSQFSILAGIQGRLIIEDSTLQDLSFLNNVEEIKGDISIHWNIFTKELTSLLPKLNRREQGHLRIEGNYNQALGKKEIRRLEAVANKRLTISGEQTIKEEGQTKKTKKKPLNFWNPPLRYMMAAIGVIITCELARFIFLRKKVADPWTVLTDLAEEEECRNKRRQELAKKIEESHHPLANK